jgi:hypothetical protein
VRSCPMLARNNARAGRCLRFLVLTRSSLAALLVGKESKDTRAIRHVSLWSSPE